MIPRMLAKLPLFRGVPQEALETLARRALSSRLGQSEAFVRRGERLPGFCLLASGELKLAVALPERGERVLSLVAAPATFGEALSLRRRPSSYDVVALAEACVMIFPLGSVETLAAELPRFGRNLVDLLAARALEVQAELEAALLRRAPQRLAAYLCSLASGSGDRVTLPVSKTLLAAVLGMKKETLSRLLRDLAERRLIEVSRREVKLLDRRRLGELA